MPLGLLRRHVTGRPQDHPRLAHRRVGLRQVPRQPEVQHRYATAGLYQDVLRLEVPVDHPLRVRVGHRPGRVADRLQAVPQRQLRRVQWPSFHVRHRQIRPPALVAEFVDRRDAGVVQPRRRARLAPQPLDLVGVGRRKVLQGHVAAELPVAGKPHLAHAALSQQPYSLVAPARGGGAGKGARIGQRRLVRHGGIMTGNYGGRKAAASAS